jgi:glycosyltransferase involved in cell wall biosynthesis
MASALSVVIITYNEERNIRNCIESVLEVADEIVVLDSFSSDATPQICSSFPHVRFYQHPWEGYSAQKNFANGLASFDWILSLDADEVLSAELRASLKAWKEQPVPAGFNRLTSFAGKWIRHGGWYPDFKFRLFDRRHTRWEGIIHEQLLSDNGSGDEIKRLQGDCLHFSFASELDHKHQTDKFSRLWAKQAVSKGKRYSMFKHLFGPGIRFVRDYVFLGGYKDGVAGLKIALVSAGAIADRQRYLKDLCHGKSID